MRMTLILMAGTAIIAGFTAYYSYFPIEPGISALDTAGRLVVCAVILLVLTLLYRDAKNDEL